MPPKEGNPESCRNIDITQYTSVPFLAVQLSDYELETQLNGQQQQHQAQRGQPLAFYAMCGSTLLRGLIASVNSAAPRCREYLLLGVHYFNAPRGAEGADRDAYDNTGKNFHGGKGVEIAEKVKAAVAEEPTRHGREQGRKHADLVSLQDIAKELLHVKFINYDGSVCVPATATPYQHFKQVCVLVPPPNGHPPGKLAFAMLPDLLVRRQSERCTAGCMCSNEHPVVLSSGRACRTGRGAGAVLLAQVGRRGPLQRSCAASQGGGEPRPPAPDGRPPPHGSRVERHGPPAEELQPGNDRGG